MSMVRRWAYLEDFNPSGSSPNVLSYLRWKDYKVSKHKDSGKPTTEEASLEILSKYHPSDPVIPRVLKARRLGHAKDYLSDTHVGRDERIHGRYGYDAETGRLTMTKPTLMNVPKGKHDPTEKELAEAIRATIVAPPGFVLIERDRRAIEALMVGYFAKDPIYMRYARLGIHDIIGQARIGKPVNLTLPDEEIKRLNRAFKKAHPSVREDSKVANHAFAYGRTVFAISKDLEKRWYDSLTIEQAFDLEGGKLRPPKFIGEAQAYVDTITRLAPKILDWQDETREEAHEKGILWTPFMYPMRFFDVFRAKDGKKKRRRDRKGRILGEQANDALSFKPQSTGTGGMIREDIIIFEEKSWAGELLLPIHDSGLFLCPEKDKKECLEYTKAVMERPFPELEGLSCETEATIGERWSQMEEVKE